MQVNIGKIEYLMMKILKNIKYTISLYPGYSKIFLSIKRAKNQNDLNKLFLQEKEKDIPEYIINKIKRDINQKHPTFNKEYDINDKNEILNSYIEKFDIFYIKQNNQEFISSLIKCKYSHKLVLLNYGKNGFDNFIETMSDFQKSFYSFSLFYTYYFHNNDEGIRFCFVESRIKLSMREFKNSIPNIKCILSNSELNMTLESLLENCDLNGNWFLNDYNEKTNSGIHFINLIIKIMGAIPNKWHYKYGKIYRDENLLKYYPRVIIDTLKEKINNSIEY